MNGKVVLRLMMKDWSLNVHMIVLSIIGGLGALGILRIGGQTSLVLGAGFFFLSMIFCASFLPTSNIVNERKKQTLAFMMSLPVAPAQYGVAKLLSTLGMFLIPWVTLVAAALYMILSRHVLPNGAIPVAMVLAGVPFIGFCLIAGVSLVSESEGWSIAATAIVNSSYWIAWYALVSYCTSLTRTWTGAVAVWNAPAIKTLGAEVAVILTVLLLTMFLQSRKRDFI